MSRNTDAVKPICGAFGQRVRERQVQRRTFGPEGLLTGFRHFADTPQSAQATPARRPA
jgi:hypothetical protein